MPAWYLAEYSYGFSVQYIDDALPAESPYLYGLHPNAEIGFLTQTSEKLFRTVLELQPRDTSLGEGAGTTREEKVSKDYHFGSLQTAHRWFCLVWFHFIYLFLWIALRSWEVSN